jgi:hypothetical protein
MVLLAGDQVRTSICLFVRLFYLLSFFLFQCAQYTICQTSSCTIHTYIHIYICIYDVYTVFYGERKGFLKNERKDCSIIYYFFLSVFFFLFYFGLLPTNRNIRIECACFPNYNFHEMMSMYVRVRVHLICFYSILPFFSL